MCANLEGLYRRLLKLGSFKLYWSLLFIGGKVSFIEHSICFRPIASTSFTAVIVHFLDQALHISKDGEKEHGYNVTSFIKMVARSAY